MSDTSIQRRLEAAEEFINSLLPQGDIRGYSHLLLPEGQRKMSEFQRVLLLKWQELSDWTGCK